VGLYAVQYTSWLGDIKQTYKAVDVVAANQLIIGVHSRKHAVRLTDKYLLQPYDERSEILYRFPLILHSPFKSKYGDSAGVTVEENSGIFSLIQMC